MMPLSPTTPPLRRDRTALIPATLPPRGAWHPSMTPRPCERCGAEEATPFRRAPLLTCNWVWSCARCASSTYAEFRTIT
jgi:hypothetical protein